MSELETEVMLPKVVIFAGAAAARPVRAAQTVTFHDGIHLLQLNW